MKFNIIDWAKWLFGIDPIVSYAEQAKAEYTSLEYIEATRLNLTAIFANKLSTLTTTESSAEVIGDNKRAKMLAEGMKATWKKKRKWGGFSYGTGGVLLVPYAAGKQLYTDIVTQDRMIINRINGDEIRAVTILADTTRKNDKLYYRMADYSLNDSGILTIVNRAVNDSGANYALTDLEEWAEIPEELNVSGVEHLPMSYIKCPVDNRRTESRYGVPITYGCDEKIKEINECLADIRLEYKLKKPMVGVDPVLFDVKNNRRNLPKTGLFMPALPGGLDNTGKLWEVYDPAIRDSAYYNRLQHLYEELEKEVGTSRGILTEQTSRGATATEIKAGMYDTFSIISDMREGIEQGLDRLIYAMDVLCNMYNLSPMGDYELSFDWSFSMLESSQESFNQLVTSEQVGAVSPAELRQFVMPDETMEEAEKRCAEIAAAKAESTNLLLDEALARESSIG